MNIYIDESGPFGGLKKGAATDQPTRTHFNTLVALAVPEKSEGKLRDLLADTKKKFGNGGEVKLNDFGDNEQELYLFFKRLVELETVSYYCAVDISVFTHDIVAKLKKEYIETIEAVSQRAKDQKERLNAQNLKGVFKALSEPLYLQLSIQFVLSLEVIYKVIDFFALRNPPTLSSFSWHIDTKQNKDYLRAYTHYAKFIPGYLKLHRPKGRLAAGNYKYIDEIYRLIPKSNVPANDKAVDIEWDLIRILTGNVSYVDSKSHAGIQAADLIASSFKRCLAGKFKNNEIIAAILGCLTTKDERGAVGTGGLHAYGEDLELDAVANDCLKVMHLCAR